MGALIGMDALIKIEEVISKNRFKWGRALINLMEEGR